MSCAKEKKENLVGFELSTVLNMRGATSTTILQQIMSG